MTGMKVATVCTTTADAVGQNNRQPLRGAGDAEHLGQPLTSTASAALSKKSMKAPPILMVNMNIRYIMNRKIGMPSIRLSTTRSMRSVMSRSTRPVIDALALAMRFANP